MNTRKHEHFGWLTAGAVIVTAVATMSQPAVAALEDDETKAQLGAVGIFGVAGVVAPENAESDLVLGAGVDLGSLWQPWLKVTAGVSHWSAAIDRQAYGQDVDGTLSDTRLYTNLGTELFAIKSIRPYLNAGVALHFVGADVPSDPSLQSALQGTHVGGEVGFGAVAHRGAITLGAGARREFVSNAKNWTFTIGIGTNWTPASR